MTSITLEPPHSFRVRVDFSPPDAAGDSSLSYQRIASDGQPIGPAVLLGPTDHAVEGGQIDSFGAAALSDNGFVVAFQERLSVGGSQLSEVLKAVVVAPDGAQSVYQFPAGGGFAAGATFANPRIEALSGDGFGVFYERHDGDQDSGRLALARPSTHDFLDVALPVPPQSITALDGNLVVDFAGGDRLVAGGEFAPTTLTGGAGDDTLIAGDNGDLIRGGGGNDSIQGGARFDNVNGNQGDDVIDGGSGGGDWLVGGQGADLITAHSGDGLLFGNLGDDTLNGATGNEVLRGGQDNDVLNGGAGNDFLSGDRGDDTLTGGAGADIFHSFSGAGVDVVTDFNAAEGDRVQLDPGSTFTVVQSGADVLIHVEVSSDVFSTVVLQNVQLSDLPPGSIFLG